MLGAVPTCKELFANNVHHLGNSWILQNDFKDSSI